ncbi:MAG: tetratricopeptide repeat protein [Acidobacteriota bacterium]
MTLGRAHLAARDGKAAVAAFDRVLAARPGDAGALLGRASALWMAGDLDGAAAALVALRGSHPELPEIAMTLALVELDRKKPDDALAAIGPLLRASPDMPQARLVNAEALMLQGNVKSALSEYRWLAALEPPSAVALSGLALAAARAGLADEARATWERARGVDEVKAREYLRKIGGSEKDVAPPS